MNSKSRSKSNESAPANFQFSICNFQFAVPLLIACLCVLASLREAPAQEQRRTQQPNQQQRIPSGGQVMPAGPNMLYSTGEDYHIGPSDVLDITVEDAPELSGWFRVNSAGTFPMR